MAIIERDLHRIELYRLSGQVHNPALDDFIQAYLDRKEEPVTSVPPIDTFATPDHGAAQERLAQIVRQEELLISRP
jgi:hypothetical protein